MMVKIMSSNAMEMLVRRMQNWCANRRDEMHAIGDDKVIAITNGAGKVMVSIVDDDDHVVINANAPYVCVESGVYRFPFDIDTIVSVMSDMLILGPTSLIKASKIA